VVIVHRPYPAATARRPGTAADPDRIQAQRDGDRATAGDGRVLDIAIEAEATGEPVEITMIEEIQERLFESCPICGPLRRTTNTYRRQASAARS
jgi:hypothetical protein